MGTYRVVWEIELDAPTPDEAAELAKEIMRDKHSTAVCFDVFKENTRGLFRFNQGMLLAKNSAGYTCVDLIDREN
jgi:hypothetical protein